MDNVTLLVFVATLCEGLVEFFVAPAFDGLKKYLARYQLDDIVSYLLRLASAIVGCIVAWQLQLGLFRVLGIQSLWPTFDIIITGVLIGRGSNYIHDLLTKFTL